MDFAALGARALAELQQRLDDALAQQCRGLVADIGVRCLRAGDVGEVSEAVAFAQRRLALLGRGASGKQPSQDEEGKASPHCAAASSGNLISYSRARFRNFEASGMWLAICEE